MLNILFEELHNIICDHITTITDLRNMSRTCKQLNDICKPKIINMENYYIEKYKDVDFVEFFKEHTIKKFTTELILDNCEHLLKDEYFDNNNDIIISISAFVGNLELIKYAKSKGCLTSGYAYSCASYSGHVNILEWFYENDNSMLESDYFAEFITRNACIGNNLNVIKWLLGYKVIKLEHYYNEICEYNAIKIFKFMMDEELIDEKLVDTIISYDNTILFQILLDNNWNISNDNYKKVIKNGSFNILKLITPNKYKIDENVMIEKINNDDIKILQLCIEYNISIGNKTYEYIFRNNYIDCFTWLYENGYKFTKYEYDYIIDCCSKKIITFCIDKQLLNIEYIYDMVYESDNYSVMVFLLENYNITKKIMLNHNNTYKCVYRLLGDHDLIIFVDNYFRQVTCNNVKAIENVKNNIITKPKYYILFENNKIKIRIVECENYVSKIIFVDNLGNVTTDDLDCDNDCWYYFLVYNDNPHIQIINYCKDKINGCNKHKHIVLNK